MMQGNYDQIIKMISEGSNLPIEEIERRIEAKRAKLSGLISKEGAAQIIASELGISFEKQKMKASNLLSGMRRISITGKIIRINKIIEYNKNGRSGKIASFFMGDETGTIRVILWDVNHIKLFENNELKEGDVIEISNGDVRNSELHLSSFGDIKLSAVILDNVQTKQAIQYKTIDKVQMNDNLSVRAFIVQIFGPTFYLVCPECNKKVSEMGECLTHGKVIPKKNAILTLIIDDGTGNIRAVLFSEQIKKMLNSEELPTSDSFMEKRNELIGKEIILEGNVRKNKLSEVLEIFVSGVSDVNLDKLLEELEK
jgi:ssDNA-binding replication factor A large subunit